jgi:hypothetical protein
MLQHGPIERRLLGRIPWRLPYVFETIVGPPDKSGEGGRGLWRRTLSFHQDASHTHQLTTPTHSHLRRYRTSTASDSSSSRSIHNPFSPPQRARVCTF